jgi:hypothetical protein
LQANSRPSKRHDLAQYRRPEQQEKGKIDGRRELQADRIGDGEGQAPGGPEPDQQGQAQTAHRQSPGPVRDRGQQEPGDRRRGVAEHHLVRVPVDRRERAGWGEGARDRGHPHDDGKGRPETGRQEEGSEPPVQDRRARITSRFGGGNFGHGDHMVLVLQIFYR